MRLKDLKCSFCDSDELFAVAPGMEPVKALDLFKTDPGSPIQVYCHTCWWRKWGWNEGDARVRRKRLPP